MNKWRWPIWSVYLLLWTVGLLYPTTPSLGSIDDVISPIHMLIAKVLHVTAYAVLAMLTGWLRVPPRYRWLLLFVIMVHATLTEVGQRVTREMQVSTRTGELYDVALDNAGIFLGLLASWKWWTEE